MDAEEEYCVGQLYGKAIQTVRVWMALDVIWGLL